MSATITDIARYLPRQPDYRKIVVEDVKNALRNVPQHRVIIAQSRALRNLSRGVPYASAVERAIAWARNAIDPTPTDAA